MYRFFVRRCLQGHGFLAIRVKKGVTALSGFSVGYLTGGFEHCVYRVFSECAYMAL